MIEKRRPHFHGVRHAHAVDFRQDIVGQKIFLVEPQIRREQIRRRTDSRSSSRPPAPASRQRCASPARRFFRRPKTSRSSRRAPRAGGMRQPSRKRFSMYSKPIFSSDTGQLAQRRAARSASARAGSRRMGRAAVGAIGQIAAEQLVRAFAAQGHRRVCSWSASRETRPAARRRPRSAHRSSSRILRWRRQVRLRIQIELLVLGSILGGQLRGCMPFRRNCGRETKSRTSSAGRWTPRGIVQHASKNRCRRSARHPAAHRRADARAPIACSRPSSSSCAALQGRPCAADYRTGKLQ